MDTVYSGAAYLGQIRTLIGAVISTIIGVMLIIGGIYMYFHVDPKVSEINGHVTYCQGITQPDGKILYKCTVNYVINEVKYTVFYYPSINTQGESVQVEYNPLKPSEATVKYGLSPKNLAIYLIIGGLALIAIGWFVHWLAYKFKFFSAIEGVGLFAPLLRTT